MQDQTVEKDGGTSGQIRERVTERRQMVETMNKVMKVFTFKYGCGESITQRISCDNRDE